MWIEVWIFGHPTCVNFCPLTPNVPGPPKVGGDVWHHPEIRCVENDL